MYNKRSKNSANSITDMYINLHGPIIYLDLHEDYCNFEAQGQVLVHYSSF